MVSPIKAIKKIPSRYYIIGGYVLAMTFLLSWSHRAPFPLAALQEKVWSYRDLYAPFEFRVYQEGGEKSDSLNTFLVQGQFVFRRDTSEHARLRKVLDSLLRRLPPDEAKALRQAFLYAYRYGYVDIPLPSDARGTALLHYAPQVEEEVPIEALVDTPRLRHWLYQEFPNAKHLWPLLKSFFPPDCQYDPALAQTYLRIFSEKPEVYSNTIQKGQLIIRQGDSITPQKAQELKSLALAYQQSHALPIRVIRFLGLVLLVTLITLLTLWYLYITQRLTKDNNRNLALILSIYLFTTMIALGVLSLEPLLAFQKIPFYHLIPLAIGPMLLAIFFDDRVGFISAITISAQIALLVPEPVEFFFVHGISSMLTVFRLRAVQRRSDIFHALLLLGLGYTVSYLGYHLYREGNFSLVWEGLIFLYVNAAVCLATYPLVYLFERVFGVSSDISFLELLNTHHPLLRELSQKAPGTYQHSLAVAILAEAAASEIGAHPLKVHVMALFHDIGKIKNPSYFIENLAAITQGAVSNPHFDLDPRESARIIKAHVRDGVELARRYGLPEEVIGGIQTHHGTTLIAYFWEKHRRQPGFRPEDEAEFRYDGPLPRTKEEAILHLADTLEASTRSMRDLTPEKLRAHVQSIISQRLQEGQLQHSSLTFAQLKALEEVFYKQLLSQHHGRIQYPSAAPAPALSS
jgi:putative nucleotidyltransferase with HDIG domain